MKKIKCLIAFLTASIALPCLHANPTLVSWWQGESNVLDSVGTNNGSVTSQLSFVPGIAGQAVDITGGLVSIPDSPSLDPATNLTVQVWVKATGSPGSYKYVLAKSAAGGGVAYAIYTAGGGGATFYVVLAGTYYLTASAPAASVWDGNWHQLTGVMDGTDVHLYLDGAEVGSGNPVSTNSISYGTPQALLLGNYAVGGAYPYAGDVDEVKIFNTALSASDVLTTFNSPATAPVTNGLVSWYRLEGNAEDSWGSNNGALVEAPFLYGPGRDNTAFFPQGGRALIPDSPSLEPSTITVQAWVNSSSLGDLNYILCKSGGAEGFSYAFYTGETAGAYFLVGSASSYTVSPLASPYQVWDGAWHQLTGTYDGAYVRLYVDGVEVGDGATNTAGIDYTSPGPLVIGDYSATGGYSFIGKIDDIKLYDGAMTAPEVFSSYDSNLVSVWQAETNADDAAGLNDGSIAGSVSYVIGRGYGFAFETAGGAVVIPDSPSLRPSNLTLEAMVRATAPGANKYIISKSDTAASASYAFLTGPSGGLEFAVTTGGGVAVSPSVPASIWDGNYHLIDGTFDSQKVHLFVDGSEVGAGSTATGAIQYGQSQSSGDLLFGDFSAALSASNFPGAITQVRLFNTALSASTIAYNAPREPIFLATPQSQTANVGDKVFLSGPAQGPPPVSYQWQLDGANIPGATNSTLTIPHVQSTNGGQYDVIATGGTLGYTNGVSGDAFHGASGGLVRISDENAVFDLQAFTIQIWARATNVGYYQYLMAKIRDPSYYSASYAFYTGGSRGLSFYVLLEGPAQNPNAYAFVAASTDNTVWDGNWHQITGTWDGEFADLYVDGALIQSVDSFGGTIDFVDDYLNGDFILGDVQDQTTIYHFPGDLDEAKFFGATLDSDDVLATFTDPSGPASTNGLIGWWKGNDNTSDSWGHNDGLALPIAGTNISSVGTLTIESQLLPPLFSGAALSSGSFHVMVTGTAGQTYVVERSTNLTLGAWTPIATNTAPFTLTNSFSAGENMFYRAVSQ